MNAEYGDTPPEFEKTLRKKYTRYGIIGALAAVLLILFLSSWTVVQEQNRGLKFRLGAYQQTLDPGLHFKVPFIETVKELSLQTWTNSFPKLEAYTKDQQSVSMKVSITWAAKPDRLVDVYRNALDLDGVTERYINSQVPTQVENTFGQYRADTVVDQREAFVKDLTHRVRETLPDYIQVVSLQVENIDFTPSYEKAAEERATENMAINTAASREQRRTTEQRVQVAQAQADADSKYKMAEADAKAIRIRGEAEADAIKARALALGVNPNLVDLTKAERWDGKLPTHVIPGNATPFISTK